MPDTFELRAVELSQDPAVLAEMIEGQKLALAAFGVSGDVITQEDATASAGTYAVVARNASGEIIAGVRLHSRLGGQPLPIESESSPLNPSDRARIAGEKDICEIRGLWVSPKVSGRFLSRKIVAFATSVAYQEGFKAVVGFAHTRTLRFIVVPLGYETDPQIPSLAYPDERFLSTVVWHRGGELALSAELPSRGLRTQPSSQPEIAAL